MSLPVAILAGGLATRLGPVSATRPKALTPIAGRPFIAWQLHLLAEAGVRRVVLLIGHLGEQIVAEVGGGTAFGLDVAYVADGPSLLGTAGAIRRALPELGERFAVLYGDSYLECDYGGVFAAAVASGLPALMCVCPAAPTGFTANAEYADGRVLAYDKRRPDARMRHIDYGLGVFSADVFADVPDGLTADLAEVYHRRAAVGSLAGYEHQSAFHEIGSPSGIAALEAHLAGRMVGFQATASAGAPKST